MAAINQYFLIPFQTLSGAGATNGAASESAPEDVRLIVTADVQQLSGTSPTVDVKLEHSPDARVWYDLGAPLPQFTGVGNATQVFSDFHGYVRAVVTLGGTSPAASLVVVASTRAGA